MNYLIANVANDEGIRRLFRASPYFGWLLLLLLLLLRRSLLRLGVLLHSVSFGHVIFKCINTMAQGAALGTKKPSQLKATTCRSSSLRQGARSVWDGSTRLVVVVVTVF